MAIDMQLRGTVPTDMKDNENSYTSQRGNSAEVHRIVGFSGDAGAGPRFHNEKTVTTKMINSTKINNNNTQNGSRCRRFKFSSSSGLKLALTKSRPRHVHVQMSET